MRSRCAIGSSLPAALRTLAITLTATIGLSLALQAAAQSLQHTAPRIPTRIAAMANPRPHANSSQPTVATPVLSLAQGAYSGPQTVTVSDATPGVTMYYTLDGSSPTASSPQYNGSIVISRSCTLVVMATLSGSASSYSYAAYYITSVPDSFIYRAAGSGYAGYGGDGGPAKQALLTNPTGTAEDTSGNVYIADAGSNAVRKIDSSTGTITTIAGTGFAGYSGDGGPATAAQLNSPDALAFDSAGNLYISDENNNVVRKITKSTGTISTYAGSDTTTPLGDGGPATSASLPSPLGIAIDTSNNLYILCPNNLGSPPRVRKVDAQTQIITTVAIGTLTTLPDPTSIALDTAGNIYVADGSNVVFKITQSTGDISIFAGTFGSYGYSGDGGPATSAKLWNPIGLAVDSKGNLYISDYINFVFRKVDATTGIISTVAGNANGCFAYVADGGAALSSNVCYARGLSFDSAGNLYFANGDSGVSELTPVGTPPSTPTADPTFSLTAGEYSSPQTLSISDATPNASIYPYIATNTPATDSSSASLYPGLFGYYGPIDLAGSAIITAQAVAPGHIPSNLASSSYTYTTPPPALLTTIAGGGTLGLSGAGGPATAVGVYSDAIACDLAGNLFIADYYNDVIWKVDISGTITIVAGTGTRGYTGDNGPATAATLSYPSGIAVDGKGNIFIADTGNDVVREVLASNGNIITYAGNGQPGGVPQSGVPATSTFVAGPSALALDGNSNLYIADVTSLVQEVIASTGIINTVAGTWGGGSVLGDGGAATSAEFSSINGLAVDVAGDLYISDTGHNRVREVNPKTGIINTVAGNGIEGFSGDGQLATDAEVNPYGIAVDDSENLFIANAYEIREVDARTGLISTTAGIGYGSGYSYDGTPASMAIVCSSSGIFLDVQSNLLYADNCGNGIRKITFNAPAPAPTFSPAAGSYSSPQSVTISDTAPNATIYYTTDGSTPTTKSTQYTGDITVSKSETINAIAMASGYGQSGVGTAAYTIGQAAPTITWATPAAITYGTPLGATQLNATASVAGTFAYSPAAGAVLPAGTQTLSVTFTPTDTADYTTATDSVTLTVSPAMPAIALTSSTNPSVVAQSVTFTATLNSSAGMPTGSVTFYDGTTSLGSGTLASGVATYTTAALSAGAHSITAQYSGNADFAPVTSTALTQTVNTFSIGPATGAPTTANGVPGSIATFLLSVTPPASNAVTFSVTGLPAGFSSSFSPNSVAAGSGTSQIELTINIPATQAASLPLPAKPGIGRLPIAFGLFLLPLLGIARSRRTRRYLLLAILFVVGLVTSAGLSACSHNFNRSQGSTGTATPPGSYALTVTATAGTQTQSTPLTLNVQ